MALRKITDLEVGMTLEGIVSNVTNFGAFVDVGVHQDGLVHISALADGFVKDPNTVVKAGQIVKVKVTEVDVARKRIALTMRLHDKPQEQSRTTKQDVSHNSGHAAGRNSRPALAHKPAAQPSNSAFADAFAKAKKR